MWPSPARLARTRFTDDSAELISSADVEVVVESTGNPVVGVSYACSAFREGKHIGMVNVEADVLVGP